SYADVNFKPEKAKGLDEEHFQVFLKIWNDTSLERFIEATGIDDVTHEQYSDAFGYIKITIYSLTRLGKEKLLLAEETR
ncbi:MAG: hypothetical protein LBQ40_03235, partial [Clostridiales bacterium]|nr:hypothetical protein [Clostridiales bacterium]